VKWLRRIIWIATGVIWFFWLGYEDKGLSAIIALAVLIAFALGLEGLARWTQKRPTKSTIWLLQSIIMGALAGAVVGPIAVILALVKISLNHPPTPDFELVSIKILVGQSLPWMAAGALFGAAGGFLKLSKKN
jgi:flagellin-like protein